MNGPACNGARGRRTAALKVKSGFPGASLRRTLAADKRDAVPEFWLFVRSNAAFLVLIIKEKITFNRRTGELRSASYRSESRSPTIALKSIPGAFHSLHA